MKVNIGPYLTWYGPYQITDMIFFWIKTKGIYLKDDDPLNERWDYVAKEKFGDWLADTWVANFCNWIQEKRKRTEKVEIHHYDVWSMDHTLALIIHPMLVKLKEQKHGAPFTEDKDVPDHLRSTSAPPLTEDEKNCGSTDKLFFDRWEYILDEMIWAFYQVAKDDPDAPEQPKAYTRKLLDSDNFDDSSDNVEAWKKYQVENVKFEKRKENGYLLFGKYYRGLWD